MKKLFVSLLAFAMVCGMVGCTAKPETTETTEPTTTDVVDGVFEGESSGFHGPVKVAVTISNGELTDVTVTEQAETYGVSDYSLSEMPKRIVANQSYNVDATTGATFTANAVKRAVKNALETAGVTGFDAEVKETAEDETLDTDVLVIGGGIAGISAALEAARAGADVVLLEKLDRLGGSSVTAGGYVYGTGSYMNSDEAIDGYHPDEMVAYYVERTDGNMDTEMVTYWAEHSGESVNFLIDEGVEFGAGVVASGTSPALRSHLTTNGGGGIMVPLYESLENEPKITLVRHAAVTELLHDGDVVTGAVADHLGATLTVNAKAVVVANGGFDRSPEYMAKYVPNSDGVPSMSSVGNTGDEIPWAEELGAQLLFKGGVMGMHTTDASYTLTGSFNLLSFVPTLGVNDKGERFMNEALDYPLLYAAMENNGTSCAWYIFNANGAYADFVPLMDLAVSRNLAKTSDTLEGLAAELGMDAETLTATVARYDELAATGVDEDFGAPLVPVTGDGAYYAVKVIRSTVAGFGGFVINTDAQVLKEDGTLFPNLFAAGECASGQFFNRIYPASGSMLSIATTFGRNAGVNAAAVALGE